MYKLLVLTLSLIEVSHPTLFHCIGKDRTLSQSPQIYYTDRICRYHKGRQVTRYLLQSSSILFHTSRSTIQHCKQIVIFHSSFEPPLIRGILLDQKCAPRYISSIRAAARRKWNSSSAHHAREPTSNAPQLSKDGARIRPTTVRDT